MMEKEKKTIKEEPFRLKLNGKAVVFVDWANIYGWRKSLGKEISPKKLYKYLRSYTEIDEIYFYFGKDKNEKSRNFLLEIKKIGYKIVTKPVKYIFISRIEGQDVYRRKCDFDMEIGIDTHEALRKDFTSFVYFSGDGDFEPLYRKLISMKNK